MKKLLALAIASAATFIAVPQAEARGHGYGGHTYISHYTSCGQPVYVQRYVAYYNSCGQPVFRTRTLPVRYNNRSHHYRRPVYQQHSNHCSSGYRQRSVQIGPVVISRGYHR